MADIHTPEFRLILANWERDNPDIASLTPAGRHERLTVLVATLEKHIPNPLTRGL